MDDLYSDSDAETFADDPVGLRAYTSRLLGQSPELVLHGGGNTSVKVSELDDFGQPVELLYVKGSGWDLATIEPAGFAPVRLDVLQKLGALETLADSDMVRIQRGALSARHPNAPNPSVEAILHGILPFTWVDHSHADSLVTITNAPNGEARVRELFGARVLVVPYVMPGFLLARAVAGVIEGMAAADWAGVEGMVLMNHGLFTFGSTAKESYQRMIRLVSECESYLQRQGAWHVMAEAEPVAPQLRELAALRLAVGEELGAPVIACIDRSAEALGYAALPNIADVSRRGPVTPDHIIRTKMAPLLVSTGPKTGADAHQQMAADVAEFALCYRQYFERQAEASNTPLTMLDAAPRAAVWPGQGAVSFGRTIRDARIVGDIARHTRRCIQRAEALGGWSALGEQDLFEMEYWELEQAKLKRGKKRGEFAGRVALVTGAASGIGAATVDALLAAGAAVVGVDIAPSVGERVGSASYLGCTADLGDSTAVNAAVEAAVEAFGGIDVVVSNAGTFPPGCAIDAVSDAHWAETLDINLTSHQRVLRATTPYLRLGFSPAVIVVGTKNVAAPGPGVSAYSVAKAGLTQLARVAALELAPAGIRVNVVHPSAVFDTGIWTDDKIAARAERYGISVDAYKRNNVLGVEIAASDVADVVVALAGEVFGKVTGAQIGIDGGNLRTI